jgi:hypothetical protein
VARARHDEPRGYQSLAREHLGQPAEFAEVGVPQPDGDEQVGGRPREWECLGNAVQRRQVDDDPVREGACLFEQRGSRRIGEARVAPRLTRQEVHRAGSQPHGRERLDQRCVLHEHAGEVV